MKVLIIILFLLLIIFSVFFRTLALNPINSIKYAFIDLYRYFKFKSWRFYECGKLDAYIAHFGGGKTLSCVEYLCSIYHKYNNKMVWDRSRKQFVLQKILILSNVNVTGVPSVKLESLSQFVDVAKKNKAIDEELNTRTCTILFVDEASSELSNRNFKENFNADFVNALITSRHFNANFLYSTQKWAMVDILLRRVTQRAILCCKVWRVMCHSYYNADELEIAGDPSLIKPIMKRGFFITDNIFNLYDTYATVEQLNKKFNANDYLSEEELIAQRGELYNQEINPSHYSRKKKNLIRKSGRK